MFFYLVPIPEVLQIQQMFIWVYFFFQDLFLFQVEWPEVT
jgi:hypothetical protein